jgi:hypothetical protein
METNEILNAPPAAPIAGDATEHPTTPTRSAVPSTEASSTEVLITEQQVMFSTAAALASRRGNRFAAIVGRLFATSTAESRESRPRRQQSQPRRTYYIERGRMAREMERL